MVTGKPLPQDYRRDASIWGCCSRCPEGILSKAAPCSTWSRGPEVSRLGGYNLQIIYGVYGIPGFLFPAPLTSWNSLFIYGGPLNKKSLPTVGFAGGAAVSGLGFSVGAAAQFTRKIASLVRELNNFKQFDGKNKDGGGRPGMKMSHWNPLYKSSANSTICAPSKTLFLPFKTCIYPSVAVAECRNLLSSWKWMEDVRAFRHSRGVDDSTIWISRIVMYIMWYYGWLSPQSTGEDGT